MKPTNVLDILKHGTKLIKYESYELKHGEHLKYVLARYQYIADQNRKPLIKAGA